MGLPLGRAAVFFVEARRAKRGASLCFRFSRRGWVTLRAGGVVEVALGVGLLVGAAVLGCGVLFCERGLSMLAGKRQRVSVGLSKGFASGSAAYAWQARGAAVVLRLGFVCFSARLLEYSKPNLSFCVFRFSPCSFYGRISPFVVPPCWCVFGAALESFARPNNLPQLLDAASGNGF